MRPAHKFSISAMAGRDKKIINFISRFNPVSKDYDADDDDDDDEDDDDDDDDDDADDDEVVIPGFNKYHLIFRHLFSYFKPPQTHEARLLTSYVWGV